MNKNYDFIQVATVLNSKLDAIRSDLLADWSSGNYKKEAKHGGSPITSWDIRLDSLIRHILDKTSFFVISEENQPNNLLQLPTDYWIVDPLDGTIEFINRTEDFAVNVAFIHNCYPVWGLIYHFVSGNSYFVKDGAVVKRLPTLEEKTLKPLPIGSSGDPVITLSSRQYNEWTKHRIPIEKHQRLNLKGASLKYLEIVNGYANLYPRKGSTGFWDTAAGQAIVEAAGGVVIDLRSKERLAYADTSLLNQGFIAASSDTEAFEFIERYQSYM